MLWRGQGRCEVVVCWLHTICFWENINISCGQDSAFQAQACEQDYFKRWPCPSCFFPALYVYFPKSEESNIQRDYIFSIWASNLIIIFLIVQFDHNFLDSWGWTQISFGCVCVLSTSVWYGDSSTIASTGWTTWSWLSPRAYLHGWRSPGELGWLFERSQELLVAKVIT